MHLLSQLREVELHFGQEMVLVGVHAGKFHAERKTENIRQAVLRLDIEHPVVNDRQFRVWRMFGVNAWPTLVFIDPAGRYVGAHAGEVRAADLIRVIGGLLADFGKQGGTARRDLPLRPERDLEPSRPLAFPGKVLAAGNNRLIVADSGHHRVCSVLLDATGCDGTLMAIAGSGEAAFADGDLSSAAFRNPQGLAHTGGISYVADTGNHAIRRIDWGNGTVTTIAGTGQQAGYAAETGPEPQVALNSPWDILQHNGKLYIAMAGAHQLWRLDLATGHIELHAGTGGEALQDGPLRDALLAQPSGLATDGKRLYFADSEASAVRCADYAEHGRVETLVGTGLFDFGDVDGTSSKVRLQHPLGIVWHDGWLYVADTYNDKIKLLDPDARSVTSLPQQEGPRTPTEAPIALYEPGGVSASDGKLYVADTNNHAIRIIELATHRISTLRVKGL